MRRSLFALAWTFILLAALYDVLFAWQYRDVFDAWEMNPFVRWTAHRFGLQAVFGFKATSLAFAAALAGYCHFHRLRIGHRLQVNRWRMALERLGAGRA